MYFFGHPRNIYRFLETNKVLINIALFVFNVSKLSSKFITGSLVPAVVSQSVNRSLWLFSSPFLSGPRSLPHRFTTAAVQGRKYCYDSRNVDITSGKQTFIFDTHQTVRLLENSGEGFINALLK